MLFHKVVNLCCSNHVNKNWGKCVARVGPSRPKGCLCEKRRGHQWKKPCGCCNASFMIKHLKAANMKIMIKVVSMIHYVYSCESLTHTRPHANVNHSHSHTLDRTQPPHRLVNERMQNGIGVGSTDFKIVFSIISTMIALITTRFQTTRPHLTCG